jgi:hypothetical protein
MKFFNPWELLPFWREIALFVVAAGSGLWPWLRTRQAHSWRTTQGTIDQVAVRIVDKAWSGEFTYTYVVEGEYYAGFSSNRNTY